MYYEINVSKKDTKGRYRHYFATAERSITDKVTAEKMYNHFKQIFPEPEFNIIVTHWESIGKHITF